MLCTNAEILNFKCPFNKKFKFISANKKVADVKIKGMIRLTEKHRIKQIITSATTEPPIEIINEEVEIVDIKYSNGN